jgi:isopentenyl phosphate kinase
MADHERELVLVKWGGSLITRKKGERSARLAVIRRLAGELAAARYRGSILLGHGSGSFGHAEAARGRLDRPVTSARQIAGVSRTQIAARELHTRVIAALAEEGILPFSLAPSSLFVAREGRAIRVGPEPVERAHALGLVPVVYGDVVMDRSRGAVILSTEAVLLALARRLARRGAKIVRALWLGDTDGVFAADGSTVSRLDPTTWRRLRPHVGGSAGTDVTGGMVHRVETALALARLGIESWILDGREDGALRHALAGRPTGGTRVPATKHRRPATGR